MITFLETEYIDKMFQDTLIQTISKEMIGKIKEAFIDKKLNNNFDDITLPLSDVRGFGGRRFNYKSKFRRSRHQKTTRKNKTNRKGSK